jgi:hypothetical protein
MRTLWQSLVLGSIAVYILVCSMFTLPSPGHAATPFTWWHPAVAVFVAAVAGFIFVVSREGAACPACKKAEAEIEALKNALKGGP